MFLLFFFTLKLVWANFKKVSAVWIWVDLFLLAKMPPYVCIFCGDTRMVVYKQLSTSTVLGKVDRQFKAGMQDPVIILCETSHR